MRMLRMLSGLAARLLRKADGRLREPGRETESGRQAAEALAAMRDANVAGELVAAEAALGGCYHDGVAYSLGYDVYGVVELCGETFTSLDSGIDGGARAALRRHRQNYDPSRDVEQFIVALRPVRVIKPTISSICETYGLPPGPLAGTPPTAKVWGEHVAKGRIGTVRRAVERVKQDCDRRGIDISKSTVTISVTPHDGQEAFARCGTSPHERRVRPSRCREHPRPSSKTALDAAFFGFAIENLPCGHPGCLSHLSHPCEGCGRVAETPPKACGECSCQYCECDGTCDPDYATSCHMCDTWVCGYCVVEGACHNCFSKMQGGVN